MVPASLSSRKDSSVHRERIPPSQRKVPQSNVHPAGEIRHAQRVNLQSSGGA